MPDEQSMIEDLRELEEELRQQGEYRKANIIDLYIKYNEHCKISKETIQKYLENEKETEKYTNKLEQDRMKLLAEIIYLREKERNDRLQ